MTKDFHYKDDAGINFSCQIKNFDSYKVGNVTLTHNNQDYDFFTNIKSVYINMMSAYQRRKFFEEFIQMYKDKKLTGLYQEDKPTVVDLSLTSENMKPLKKELQELSREYIIKNRKKGNTYEVILKDITPDEIIVRDKSNTDYSFRMDLMDTHFFEYTEEERRKIIKYAKSFIKSGETIRVTEQGFLGTGSIVNVYFGPSYLNSLNDKIREIIKPYQDRTLYGNHFYALVSRVIDGDTIEVFNGQKRERIRLNGIDCPEKKQAFGAHATAALNNLVKYKKIKIQYTKEEKYGRILGTIFIENNDFTQTNVNLKMIEEGFALSSNYLYDAAEASAKKIKKGIWAINFEKPSEFRNKNKFFKKH